MGADGEAEDDPALEAIECPVCLAPGFVRACCGAFYCNECYFRNNACPNCGKACVSRGFQYEIVDPGVVPVGVGWYVTMVFGGSMLLIVILVVYDEAHRRDTVAGFHCYKWFGACDRATCTILNSTAPLRMTDNNDWHEGCEPALSLNKVLLR